MAAKSLLLIVLFSGVVWGQSTESSIFDSFATVPDISPELQGSLAAELPPELKDQLNKEQIEMVANQSAAAFKDKCEKNGGPNAFSAVQDAIKEFQPCLERLINVTAVQAEVEEAKGHGAVDEVFKKYCDKTPNFKACFNVVLDAAKPCFSENEKKNIKIVHNVTEQLAEFVCFKGGDRIALFIAEGGPTCLNETKDKIQDCFNSTMSAEYKGVKLEDMKNLESLPEISFGEEECNRMARLQKCVVTALEGCKQPTTANIVESLVKFVRNATPCKNFPIPEDLNDKPNSASGLVVTSLSLLMGISTLLIL